MYEQNLSKKLTRELVASLLFDCDLTNELNKRLIKLCAEKKIFSDDEDSIIFFLVKYSKQLLQMETVETSDFESLSIKDQVTGGNTEENQIEQGNMVGGNRYIPNLLAMR